MNPFETIPEPLSIPKRTRRRYLREYVPSAHTDETAEGTTRRPNVRVQVLLLTLLVGFGVLFVRAVSLQVANGARYRELAEGHRLKIETVAASRGIVVDRRGEPLLENVPSIRLTLQPNDLPRSTSERDTVLNDLSAGSGVARQEIDARIADHTTAEPIVLRDNLSDADGLRLMLDLGNLPGVGVATVPQRSYLLDDSLSHVVGYVGAVTKAELDAGGFDPGDVVGRTGIEAKYDGYLRGTNGRQEIERDAHGRTQKVIASVDPVPGGNLRLTLDGRLQSEGQRLLDAMVRQRRSPGGALVALDPRNGAILALASSPTFSANELVAGLTPEAYASLSSDPRAPLFNRAITGMYPPGSTIKPVIAAAALQERVITPSTTVVSTGGIRIGQWFFPDWKAGGHGATNVTKAIAESVNTFFYLAGGGDETHVGLGLDRMRLYAERFGLNRTLGVDLPGERPGFLPTMAWKEETKGERWYIGDTYHLAIGQGDILVTPLQVAAYTMAIANGGTLYRPHLVQAILDASDRVVSEAAPAVIRNVGVDSDNLAVVRQGLRQTVTSGSGQSLGGLPVSIAAKTGTAQFGNEGKTHAWLTAFAPYEDPEIVVSVFVEGGGEGHETALPVARSLIATWLESRGTVDNRAP